MLVFVFTGAALRSFFDFELAMQAKRSLASDPLLSCASIRIEVHAGRALLSGTVRRQLEKWAAEADIRRLDGICGIENRISVLP